MISCFKVDNIPYDLPSTFYIENGISSRICCNPSILQSNTVLRDSLRKGSSIGICFETFVGGKISTLYTLTTKMFSRSSWAHKPQIKIRRERFPNGSKGAKEAWSVSLQQLLLPSALASWRSEDKGRLCNCVYKSWVRMRQVRGSKRQGWPIFLICST